MVNWPLVILLLLLCIPGVFIAIPRVISFLLRDNDTPIKRRLLKLAIIQSAIMVSILTISGSLLSYRTGLDAPLFQAILAGKNILPEWLHIMLPVFLITIIGVIVFFVLYYAVFARFMDEKSLMVMKQLRLSIGLDGAIFYGGIVEEVMARWGIMNLTVFFGYIFFGGGSSFAMYSGIIASGLFFGLGHLPTYLAAGCQNTRKFMLMILALNLWVSIIFGYLF